jgi:hypothetical protein
LILLSFFWVFPLVLRLRQVGLDGHGLWVVRAEDALEVSDDLF